MKKAGCPLVSPICTLWPLQFHHPHIPSFAHGGASPGILLFQSDATGSKKKDLDMKQGITPEQTVKQYLVT